MEDTDVFAVEAADVAMKAIEEGVARRTMSWQDVHDRAATDIRSARELTQTLMDNQFIPEPPAEMLEEALSYAVSSITGTK